MFTGIIKDLARIKSIAHSQNNMILELESSMVPKLSIDQSLSHNGICLTVDGLSSDRYTVVAIEETQRKTTISKWQINQYVNLEKAMQMNSLLDGHILQGHVDDVTEVLDIKEDGGSNIYTLGIPTSGADLIVEKGSVALDGVSLTCFEVTETSFQVAVIPYTLEHTAIQYWVKGIPVNIEFDIIAKLVSKQVQKYLKQTNP